MMCTHCGRHISPTKELGNGSRYLHDDNKFRLCNPHDRDSLWASPAPETKEPRMSQLSQNNPSDFEDRYDDLMDGPE